MPRIPIIPPPEDGEGGDGTCGGPDALAPEEAAALRALQARTARIDRELAFSQIWLASVERLGEAEAAPEGPPPGFTRNFLDQADRERADLLKTLPPGRRSDLEQDLLDLRGDLAGRAADVEASGLALRRRVALQQTLEGYRTGVARDPGLYDRAAARMESLVADLGLPEDRREPMRLHVKDALGNAALDGLMGEPERAARVLSQGLYDDALTEASKAARLKEAEGLIARRTLLTRERALSELTAQAGEGAVSEDAIAAAETGGRLTAAEANQLRLRNAEAAQAAELREARIQRVASASGSFDPLEPEDKAAVNDYWDRVSEAYASEDAAAQQKAELAFVARVGVLPDGLSRKYQGALLSDEVSIAVLGAQAIDTLSKLDPALLDRMPQERVRHAHAVAQYADLGLTPERAIELAARDIEKGEGEPVEPIAPSEPAKDASAGELVESNTDAGFAPGDDATAIPGSASDQTDGPFERVEGDTFRSVPVTEPDQELSEDRIDELLHQDGLAPVPRGDAPVDVAGDREVSPLARMAAVGWNEFLAVQQWTSPDTSRYEKLGRYSEADFGGVYIDAAGQWVPVDLRRHAVLIDPNRGELWVYRRSPETDESRLLSFARLFGMGLSGESSVTSAKAALRARQLAEEGAGDAARTFGVGIGPTGRGAAETISGAAKGEAWAVEKAVPGIGKDAGLVHKVTKPGKASFASEETTLFMVPREPLAADVLKTGRPLGLMDDATFTEFKNILREEKAKLPPNTGFAIRGSAVTGNGFKDTAHGYAKDFFDAGRTSDHDIAIVSRSLFEKARNLGVELRQGNTRTDELSEKEVRKLDLLALLQNIHDLTGRKRTKLMIYKSVDTLNKRGTNIQFDLR